MGAAAGEEPGLGCHHRVLAGASTRRLPLNADPADRPAPVPMRAATCLARWSARSEPDTASRLPEVSRRLGVTPFTVLLAAYGYLLHQLCGQEEPSLSGCRSPGAAIRVANGVVGNCSTTLPVRRLRNPSRNAGTRARPGDERNAGCRALTCGLLSWRATRPSTCAQRRSPRSRSSPSGFNLDRGLATWYQLRGLQVTVAPAAEAVRGNGLPSLDLLQADGNFRLTVKYDADLFDQATADLYAAMYEQVLRQFVADPDMLLDRVGLVPAAAVEPLLARGRGPASAAPAQRRCLPLLRARLA